MHCVRTCLLQIQILRTIPKHEAVYLVTIQKYYCTLIPEPLGKAHLVDGMQKHQSAADLGEVTTSLVHMKCVPKRMSVSVCGTVKKTLYVFQTIWDKTCLVKKKLNDRSTLQRYVFSFIRYDIDTIFVFLSRYNSISIQYFGLRNGLFFGSCYLTTFLFWEKILSTLF